MFVQIIDRTFSQNFRQWSSTLHIIKILIMFMCVCVYIYIYIYIYTHNVQKVLNLTQKEEPN